MSPQERLSFRGRVAFRVARLVSATDDSGRWKHGGRGRGKIFVDENDQQVAIAIRGEGLDIVVGKKRFAKFTVSAAILGQVVRWAIWWWVFYAWLGLRMRLWRWAIGVMLDDAARAEKQDSNGQSTS